MARTAVPYSNLVANGTLADPAGTAVSSGAGNGGQIPATSGGGARPERTILRCSNASGGPGTVTIIAGDYPPALASGLGNYTSSSIANGAVGWIGPLESGRFLQADGSIEFETSVNMTVTAFNVPRNT